MTEQELIPLREAAELAGLNPNDSLAAAQRCAQQRVNLVTRYRDQQPVLYIAAADVERFLGATHPVVRGYGWRLGLREQRRRHTRALKASLAGDSREARVQAHLQQVQEEVREKLARRRPTPWRTGTAQR